ncbi:MAG: HAD family hydrolase [Proteobacteria bacterium]|nr:HAD family hydrolase [Pseudomonadota bacterium]
MTIKAIIFDLDGTLLHTLVDLGETVNEVLEARQYPTHQIDKYKYFIGDGAKKLIERALPESRRSSEEILECLELFHRFYDEKTDLKTAPFPGISELLDQLASIGISLNILSNKPHKLTLKAVSSYLGRWPFQIIFGQREGVPHKPDPAGLNEIIEKLSLTAEDCLYLGDTSTDMITANAAGVKSVGVTWGYRPRSELEESGAHYTIESPEELLQLITEG